MAVLLSTGYCAAIFGPQAFENIFLDGCIEIYSGAQPANADMAPTGTLLGRITRDGLPWTPGSPQGGLQFIRSGRYVLKPSSHTWVLSGLAAGTAGWCRLRTNNGDLNNLDLNTPRIDGAVGLEGADATQLYLQSVTMSPGLHMTINHWWLAEPPIGA